MEKFVPFLKTVADDLVLKNAESKDFSKMTVVFPNKRARLFMDKYLLQAYREHYNEESPIWSPAYATSSNLLEQFASMFNFKNKIVPDADKVLLIQILYWAYQKVSNARLAELDAQGDSDEVPKKILTKSFDEFYFLGEIILNDFDDVDKNLVDAKSLFRNFKEFKDLETLDYLTEEQIKAVQDFLKRDFNTETALFKGFITLWEILGDVYECFKKKLDEESLAYSGMLHRRVAERMDMDGLPPQLPDNMRYVFVGFNALNGCEKKLLKKLSKKMLPDGQPAALFYWDYDISFFDPSNLDGAAMRSRRSFRDDAGTFLRVNIGGLSGLSHTARQEGVLLSLPNELKNNANELDSDRTSHDYLSRLADGAHVRVFSASTDTSQAKYVSKFVSDLKERGVKDDEIAIVLCDEKLLPAVLHSIPDSVKKMNVTMGFPVTQTPAYALVQTLAQLQFARGGGSRFPYMAVVNVLRNGIVRKKMPTLSVKLANVLKEETKTYVSVSEMQGFAKNLATEEVGDGELDFAGKVFSLCEARMDKPADGLVGWMLDVLASLSSVFRSDIRKRETLNLNFTGLYEEAFFQVYRMLTCLSNGLEDSCKLGNELTVALFFQLMSKMFASAKVPYSGEPARGLQIMGFLETRSLDFKHVLMLSVGEKYMPKDSFAPSFIPYALRIAYQLPAVEHEDALYAYNFFRQMQRPSSITLLFNTSTGTSGGEQSRFLRQLKDEYHAFSAIIPLAFPDAVAVDSLPLVVEKKEEDLRNLCESYRYMTNEERVKHNDQVKKTGVGVANFDLSPSALNSYLDCSLRFYFQYVKRLSADEDVDMDVDEAFFGRIFHRSMELVYCEIAKQSPNAKTNWKTPVSTADLTPFLKQEKLESIVDTAFKEEFHINSHADYSGIQLIKRDVLVELLRKQLTEDVRYAEDGGFTMYEPEYRISQKVEVELRDNTVFAFRLGGIIDRRDLKGNVFRVVDYKTGGDAGGTKRRMPNVERMFVAGDKRADKAFQATLYSCLWNFPSDDSTLCYNKEKRLVRPALMFPREMNEEYSPNLTVNKKTITLNSTDEDDTDVQEEFWDNLKNVLRNLLDKNVPFKATDDVQTCTFCDFKSICHREDSAKR